MEAIIALRLINYKSDWAILGVVTDITHLKRIELALQKAINEQALLLDSARKMTAALELESLLEAIIDQLRHFVKFNDAVVLLREGDGFVIRASHTSEGRKSLLGLHLTLDALPVVEEMIINMEPIIVDDASTSMELIQEIESAVGQSLEEYVPAGASLMGFPLTIKEQVIGLIVLSYIPARIFFA